MKFSSREIFNFVFEPNKLSFEQREYIKNHFTKFNVEVDICNSAFIAISSPGVKQIPKQVIELLFDQDNKNIQVLSKIEKAEDKIKISNNFENSEVFNSEYDVLSFTNNTGSVTVLIYSSEEEKKISAHKTDTVNSNLIIRLLPSNTIVNFDDEHDFFDIEKGIEVIKVELLT